MTAAGLSVTRLLEPLDSVINAYPTVQSDDELSALPGRVLRERFGALGGMAARIPVSERLVWRRLRRPQPGRLYTFVAERP